MKLRQQFAVLTAVVALLIAISCGAFALESYLQ